jgi:hypothetical protein
MIREHIPRNGKTVFAKTIIVEWFDRVICAVSEFPDGTFTMHCLVAWSFDESRGIRLYFPIGYPFFHEVETQLAGSWESACSAIREFAEQFSGDVVIALECDAKNIRVGSIRWPVDPHLFSTICDIDSVMNVESFLEWRKFVVQDG